MENGKIRGRTEMKSMTYTQGAPTMIPHSGGKDEPKRSSDKEWMGHTPWDHNPTVGISGGADEPKDSRDREECDIMTSPYTAPKMGNYQMGHGMNRSQKEYYSKANKTGKTEGQV